MTYTSEQGHPTRSDLAAMDEAVLRYMAPMNGPGKPYGEELIRRRVIADLRDALNSLYALRDYAQAEGRAAKVEQSAIDKILNAMKGI